MYLVKNAWRNMIRGKGKNILMGVIITLITISSCVAISIHKSGSELVKSYQDSNPLEVSFQLSPMDLRNASDEEKEAYQALTIDMILSYADSDYISDYYYLQEITVSSNDMEAVDYSTLELPDPILQDDHKDFGKGVMQAMGDFRLTAYSDFSYLDDFVNGVKKINEGSMIEKGNTDYAIVISQDLASQNGLSLNDTITLTSNDEEKTITVIIIGIFEDHSDASNGDFMNMNALNSRNQIYTTMTTLEALVTDTTSGNKQMMSQNGLTAKFLLNDRNDLTSFENEVREKGLSTYYSLMTNENEILESLEPIQNLSSFSLTFLLLILIVGGLILAMIQMIHIRDRKYEIGVLRAIGMSKSKVAIQMVLEVFLVSIIAFLVGTGLGAFLSQPVTNQMLSREIASNEAKTEAMQENFGGGNFSRPGMGKDRGMNPNQTSPEYVSTLTVTLDFMTILELFGVCVFLTITSGMISVMVINKYQPNQILQNRV